MAAFTEERVAISRRRGGLVATHEWFREFAARINKNPAETEGWLVLSDRLRDAGLDRCADLIQSLWGDGSVVPPDGEITRGFHQWENGAFRWVGVTISVRDGQWFQHYWSNGSWRTELPREQARKVISWAGLPWRREKRQAWTGEIVVSEGMTPASEMMIAVG